ncbi:protein of unknown function DUF1470 [Deinococcus proteolyticus MRP]|uniref:Zinc finger CGNR domain-containing protein n=1 Tax=Deinococcus proteolyticus (strain ATCC 35074 / DSM 20540 / JCM 6276 / NBRC 101906 / NCIMB 13154 / VKM Ac-1939 / CCM 2703 / MRP) TaxID=693977 RepID=F0RJY0_DEIPM|nr:CGNR zinc finger domain-containing protein [Deinococcus proteolyticus]ADY26626.1 protein of unknown function DUF1470 [Deinococcus proteolyticus MRP]
MNSDANSAGLFASWSMKGKVDIDLGGQVIIFSQPEATMDLFARPGGSEGHYRRRVEALLSLHAGSTADEWQAVAQELGPLFTVHPLHALFSQPELRESMDLWLKAGQDLRLMWSRIEKLTTASPDAWTQAEREEIGLQGLETAGADLDALSEDARRKLAEAYTPQEWASEAGEVVDGIGQQLNSWFRATPSRVVPLVNPETLQVELVVEQGIQALALMSVLLIRNDRSAFPRQCGRTGCTRITFMKGRRRFCSKACQEAAKSQRYRSRRAAQGE